MCLFIIIHKNEVSFEETYSGEEYIVRNLDDKKDAAEKIDEMKRRLRTLINYIDDLCKNFAELYIYTYTDILPSCNTVMECSEREELFVVSKNGVMDKLLKRNYFNRSFGNILQFIERAFLCKIRDNMRLNTKRHV